MQTPTDPDVVHRMKFCQRAGGRDVKDLVRGRWRRMDAGAEVRDEQELGHAGLALLERDDIARNADRCAIEGGVDGRVVPDVAEFLEQLRSLRVGIVV